MRGRNPSRSQKTISPEYIHESRLCWEGFQERVKRDEYRAIRCLHWSVSPRRLHTRGNIYIHTEFCTWLKRAFTVSIRSIYVYYIHRYIPKRVRINCTAHYIVATPKSVLLILSHSSTIALPFFFLYERSIVQYIMHSHDHRGYRSSFT